MSKSKPPRWGCTTGAANTAVGYPAMYNQGTLKIDTLRQTEVELLNTMLEQLAADPAIPADAIEALGVDSRLRGVVTLRILLRDPDMNKKILAELTNMRLRGEDTWT